MYNFVPNLHLLDCYRRLQLVTKYKKKIENIKKIRNHMKEGREGGRKKKTNKGDRERETKEERGNGGDKTGLKVILYTIHPFKVCICEGN